MQTFPSDTSRFDLPIVEISSSILPGRTEAEELSITQGYAAATNPHASGGSYLEASADTSRAAGVFEGPAGLYQLVLGYMDETDGVSYMEVLVNGRVIAAFDWASPAGTDIVTAASRAEHLVAGLVLAPGDVIELRGAQDGGEPLRTDFIEITPAASPLPGQAFTIEAESFEVRSGFAPVANGAASGGQVLQHTGEQVAHALYEVQQSGRFDLSLTYFDETDGVSWLQVLHNGEEIAAFEWASQEGSALADSQSRTERRLPGVDLLVGDRLEFIGRGDGGEPLRLDALRFSRVMETTLYDPFLSELPTVEMEVRRGEHIALLTSLANASRYDDAVLQRIVAAIDSGWEFYAMVTGRVPERHWQYSIDGLGTVAVPERTIGAGGGYLGLTGIEIWADPYFDVWMHDNVRDHDMFDHIPFYELGRNFWFYSGAIGALPVAEATSFAVTSQYFALDHAGVDVAPFNNWYPWVEIRAEILDDLSQYYLQDPALDWSNTIDINAAPDWLGAFANWDGGDLLASFFARMAEDFGIPAYAEMWQLIGQAPYTSDPQAAAETFLNAARQATGVSYHFLRKQGGEVFVIGDDRSNTLISPEAPSGPVVMHGFAGDDLIENRATWSDPGALLFGGAGNDHLISGQSDDTMVGGTGDDILEGKVFNTGYTYGGPGDDWISAQGRVWGGAGADTFAVGILVDGVGGSSVIRIGDYEPDHDVIDLQGYPIDYAKERADEVVLHIAVDQLRGDDVYISGASEVAQIIIENSATAQIPLRYEAEDMQIVSGFEVVRNGVASAGYMLEQTGSEPGHARLLSQKRGIFDITVGYFDETDGVSSMAVLLNGAEIAAFEWDDITGSAIVTRDSRAEFTVESVALVEGDVIALIGQGDGGEPLRTDFVELTPTGIAPPEPAPASPDLLFFAQDEIFLARNDGAGHFGIEGTGISTASGVAAPATSGFLTGDFDADGDTDILQVVADLPFEPQGITENFRFDVITRMFANDGGGVFVEGPISTVGVGMEIWREDAGSPWPLGLVFSAPDAADIDGDGAADFVGLSVAAQNVFTFQNDGTGAFGRGSQQLQGLGEYYGTAKLADMNGDIPLDLVYFTDDGGLGTAVAINDGAEFFLVTGWTQPGEGTWLDQIIDIDRDGDNDVIFGAWGDGRGTFVYLNDGTGDFEGLPSLEPMMEDAFVGNVLAANFDDDPEIEMVNLGADLSPRLPGLRILELVEGTYGLTLAETDYDPSVDGGLLFHADFDLDGDVDLLLSQEDAADAFSIFANDGAARFAKAGPVFEGGVPDGFGGFMALGYFDEAAPLL